MSDIQHTTVIREHRYNKKKLLHARLFASGLLLLAVVFFVFSCFFLQKYPHLVYVKAFSEAAIVGALADWFAISALFRHPLGLPIPHTAILPRKQHKIADELSKFIEHNFLQEKSIATRIYKFHIGQKMVIWLQSSRHRQIIIQPILKQLPFIMMGIRPLNLIKFINTQGIQKNHARLLSKYLFQLFLWAYQQNIPQKLIRIVLQEVKKYLKDKDFRKKIEKNLLLWAGSIKKNEPNSWDKLKSSLKVTLANGIDEWVTEKSLDWADSYINAVLSDPQHPFWRSTNKKTLRIIRQLRDDSMWQEKISHWCQQMAYSAELQEYIEKWWSNICIWSQKDVSQTPSWWKEKLNVFLFFLCNYLNNHPHFIRKIDLNCALISKHIIHSYKHLAAQFISDKVKGWDSTEMVNKLELSVGKDLQFIRINGTIVGGIIGLFIYTLSNYFFP